MALKEPVTLWNFSDSMYKGRALLGLPIRHMRTQVIFPLVASSGHDFAFLDTQHGVYNVEAVDALLACSVAAKVPMVVRVASVSDPHVELHLDSGAAGVVFPDIASADMAAEAVQRCRFPPHGRRSVPGTSPNFMLDADGSPDPSRADVAVICMVESEAGLDGVDAIAAVDGVDVVHLGSSDFLQSCGLAGQFSHPRLGEAIESVIRACQGHGKIVGVGGLRDVDRQARLLQQGVRFLTTQGDYGLLKAGATAWVERLRGGGT